MIGPTSTSLSLHSTVEQLVRAFEDAARVVRESFAAIVTASEAVNAAFTLGGSNSIWIDASDNHSSNFHDAEKAVRRMAKQAWTVLVERLELRRLLSSKRYEELQRSIQQGEVPEITLENVTAFVQGYIDQMLPMHTEAIVEVFDWLRPRQHSRAADYKRNGREEVGERVILTYAVERGWGGKMYHVCWGNHTRERLQALENVLNMLDGRGFISKGHFSDVQNAIAESATGHGETDLFEFRCHKNGNLHLRFKRRDLLKRFNMRAGGNAIRETSEHDNEAMVRA